MKHIEFVRSRWVYWVLAVIVPGVKAMSLHLAQLCPGIQCGFAGTPLLDYDPEAKRCTCVPHPCWDDNGQTHVCTEHKFPFLAFAYLEDGSLHCKCSHIPQVNSNYMSRHMCPGHDCDKPDFPVLDIHNGQCVCRPHPCWNVGGQKHSCEENADFPILHYRVGKGGEDVCECLALLNDPFGTQTILHNEAEDDQTRREATNMEHGFPMPPDTRPSGCKDITEDVSQLTVSVVLPWLGEKWYHMEATLKSLIYFTPDTLVKEFIFVSDGNADSREAELKAISDKVKVLAFPERVGLMVAKTKGVQMATAPVLVFMEAHCIVNRGWLEPLLQRLVDDPKTLAMPSLDIIPERNFYQYRKTDPGYWRHEWNFNLIYTNPGDGLIQDAAHPYLSPGTSGGIFAIRRDWFNHLGFFDKGMQQWGGDHIELTMKVWRCGGLIEIVPCSRIGHVFRTPAWRPYDVEVPQVVNNYARLARIWAGDYLENFYKVKPEARFVVIEDIDDLQQRHDELGCEDMQWYLDHVDVEMGWEADKACIPGAPLRDGGCEGPAIGMHSTMDRTMPRADYLNARMVAVESLEASRTQSGKRGKAWEYLPGKSEL